MSQGAPEAAGCPCPSWGGQSSRAACPGVRFATSGPPADLARECPCSVTARLISTAPLTFPSGSKSKDSFLALIYFLELLYEPVNKRKTCSLPDCHSASACLLSPGNLAGNSAGSFLPAHKKVYRSPVPYNSAQSSSHLTVFRNQRCPRFHRAATPARSGFALGRCCCLNHTDLGCLGPSLGCFSFR